IREVVISEPNNARLRYGRGSVHWLPDLPSASALAAELVARGGDDIHVVPAAGTYFYNFNCQPTRPDGSPNPLANPDVRRALSMAINRDTLVREVTRVGNPPAATFIPPGSIRNYTPPTDAGVSFNPTAAAQLLASAGYADGEGLGELTILFNTDNSHEKIAQFIAASWKDHLGVRVTLQAQPSKAFGQRLDEHDFTIARAGWFGDYRDPTTFLDKFISDSPNNDAAWSNPAFDKLMKEAEAETDPQARLQRLERAEALMLAAQPIAPLFHYVNLELFRPDEVAGIRPNPWNVRRLDQVRLKKTDAP
ncbi:MAG: peptide ABC transporter substrate-binding protein, partial [Phycisphaeraceae bacterium]|nr:peptide ABC transporter substrate-binding protein [Phycisphaeraceae bacterium]